MTAPTFSIPTIGQPNSTEDVDIANALSQIYTILSGNIDSANIASGAVGYSALATGAANAFLKLTTAADKHMAFGTTTVTCSSGGGSGLVAYGSASVTHGMGLTPSYVLLTVKNGGTIGAGDAMVYTNVSSIGSSTFSANASLFKPATDLINGTVSVAWAAID